MEASIAGSEPEIKCVFVPGSFLYDSGETYPLWPILGFTALLSLYSQREPFLVFKICF